MNAIKSQQLLQASSLHCFRCEHFQMSTPRSSAIKRQGIKLWKLVPHGIDNGGKGINIPTCSVGASLTHGRHQLRFLKDVTCIWRHPSSHLWGELPLIHTTV